MVERRWIPCSERLPEIEHKVSDDLYKGHYLTFNKSGAVQVLSWCDGFNCYRDFNGKPCKDHEIKGILAWMPLPKPFEESEEYYG